MKKLRTPLGLVRCLATERGVCGVYFSEHRHPIPPCRETHAAHEILDRCTKELGAYFAGECWEFSLPLDVSGTAFQHSIWSALKAIPLGETRTYGELASVVGKPKAVRAVGAANGRNPVSILVPCHRVVGANGTLTGYAGGLEAKRWLLDHEVKMASHRRVSRP